VQVVTALAAFDKSRAAVQAYAPGLNSERSVAFMIDIANQYGDDGAKDLFETVNRPGISEAQTLEAIADESVQRITDKYKGGVRARRDTFLNTPLLNDEPFIDAASPAAS
jgi:hypothetical protein